MKYIEQIASGNVLTIRLNRPDVKNAMNLQMINELTEAFSRVEHHHRLIVLEGNGTSFCAGADLEWMQSMVNYSFEQNLDESRQLQTMLKTIDSCPQPIIGKLQGAVMGGGVGLAAVCDFLLCADNTKFCLSEVKLGLVPAIISPFIISKLSLSRALALGLTAQLFSCSEALQWGFVHAGCKLEELDEKLEGIKTVFLQSAPLAQRETKKLFKSLHLWDAKTRDNKTVEVISRQRVSREGQKGLKGFLSKHPVKWEMEKVESEAN